MRGLQGKVVSSPARAGAWARPSPNAWQKRAPGSPSPTSTRSRRVSTATALEGAAGFRLDITDADEVTRRIDEIVAALGPIDALVNNAGWDRLSPFLDTDEDLWERLIDINLRGPIRMTKAVLPQMVERQTGRIVNISSDAGRVGSSGEAVYSACKAGIIGFGKTVAREVARYGVTVNAICPGPTDTALLESMVAQGNEKIIESLGARIPMRRIGLPDDIAGAVAFMVSDDAGFITGQTLSVSGGLTMA